jgi:tetratricopeptide (TPR) repeat protein
MPAETAAAFARRARFHIELGEFRQAADDLADCINRDPTFLDAWCDRAVVLANLCDPGYDDHCRRMLDQFEGTTHRVVAERTAKACLLLPRPPDECRRLLALADVAIAGGKEHPNLAWFWLAKGLAEYRVENFESALECASKAWDQRRPERDAHADLIAAMAQHRLGRHDQARDSLARAGQVVEGMFAPGFTVMGFGVPAAAVARREARNLIAGEAASTQTVGLPLLLSPPPEDGAH